MTAPASRPRSPWFVLLGCVSAGMLVCSLLRSVLGWPVAIGVGGAVTGVTAAIDLWLRPGRRGRTPGGGAPG
jgi:hypothetical protein